MDFSHNSRLRCSEDNKVAKLERRDRLSELPDSLIYLILSLLNMKDVVRTTILSKRWEDLWTTVPCLHFWDQNPSFIHMVLAKLKGTEILKFSIGFSENDPPPSDILDSWLLVPIEKLVEDLSISLLNIDTQYCPPQPLYSCSSITKLSLSSCDLEIEENVNVQWNQLKSLQIGLHSYLSEDAMNRILSGAPLLEELVLLSWNISENLNIRSTSLKVLKIKMDIDMVSDFEGNAPVLKIWAPNLESLEISELWQRRCLLNVPSLTNASLGFDYRRYHYMLYKPSRYTELEEMLRQAFLGLSFVEKLTLNEWAIKFLVDEMKRDNCVLFPKMVMLIVKQDPISQFLPPNYIFGAKYHSLVPKSIFPSLSLPQLKTIVITWDVVDDDSIFACVEILLENARALEKMVLRLRKHKYYSEESVLALEKVLSMPRASPYAKNSEPLDQLSGLHDSEDFGIAESEPLDRLMESTQEFNS